MTRKDEWDNRARENAAYWVLTGKKDWDDEAFFKQGEEDVNKYVVPFLQKNGFTAEKQKTITALDVGCGLGRLTKALQPLFYKVIGVDISSEMIRQAKEKNPSVEFFSSEADNLPIQTESIDYVFSFISFQHFPSKRYVQLSFKEVLRVLKSGGVAQIQVRGVPGNKFRSPRWWVAFNHLWLGFITIKGVPIPFFGIFGFRGSIFGAAFKEGEIKGKLLAMGFSEVKTWHESPRHLWVYLRK